MIFFKKFTSKQVAKWTLGALGLSDWWMETFTEKERSYIVTTFQPLWWNGKDLIEGDMWGFSEEISSLLWSLAWWFKNEDDRLIAYRMIDKWSIHSWELHNVLDLHFFYQNELEIYYRFRDIDDFALDRAISACRKQISISEESKNAFLKEYPDARLPTHKWYEQLIIAYTKQWKIAEAIELVKEAMLEWWNWDWDKKIKRLENKL